MAGRPLTFPTPEDLSNTWEEYKKKMTATQGWINKEHFLRETGNYINLLNEYAKKPAFSGVLLQIETDCKQYLLEKGLKNEYNPTIVKLIAAANYGMSDKIDTKNDNTNKNISMDFDQYKERLEEEERKARESK